MKKIPNLFLRDDSGNITREINPVAQWVADGEGFATRKYDGTSCMVKDGKLFKRRMVKPRKPIPGGFIEVDYDPNTGKKFGWIPVDFEDKANKYHKLAWEDGLEDGTYELCGPKVQGNAESLDNYTLIPHGRHMLSTVPKAITFDSIREHFSAFYFEGVVWHHEDGRMVKVRHCDVGTIRYA